MKYRVTIVDMDGQRVIYENKDVSCFSWVKDTLRLEHGDPNDSDATQDYFILKPGWAVAVAKVEA
jgi:hypothetical protein